MLIINADDFGRNRLATDNALQCHRRGCITSLSAMVFMDDSERAADLTRALSVDVGLHLNLTEQFTKTSSNNLLPDFHGRIARFLTRGRYAPAFYAVGLRNAFQYVLQAQFAEYERLYGKSLARIDGHHHMHLCANILVDRLLSPGLTVRRNFTFAAGEKPFFNRLCRAAIDRWLNKRYRITDYLFPFSACMAPNGISRIENLAESSVVEVETHPELRTEYEWLIRASKMAHAATLKKGAYAQPT